MTQGTRRLTGAVGMAGACALSVSLLAQAPSMSTDAAADGILPTEFGESVDKDVKKVRKATEKFRTLDKAVDAGYAAEVTQCIEHQPHGAMGFHHSKQALLDDRLEVDRPEILVYERLPDGQYRLNGVEYIVPLSAWTREEPPTIMGQKLKRAESLGIWYLHVWVWQKNPSGLFADWNPTVKC